MARATGCQAAAEQLVAYLVSAAGQQVISGPETQEFIKARIGQVVSKAVAPRRAK